MYNCVYMVKRTVMHKNLSRGEIGVVRGVVGG